MARAAFRNRRRFHLRLDKLKTEVAEEIGKATERNARDVHLAQLAFVPVGQYEGGGQLRDSLKYYEVAGSRRLRWKVTAGDEKAFYARMVEFGTPRQRATPFFYPAYRSLRKRIRARYSRAFRLAKRRIFRP